MERPDIMDDETLRFRRGSSSDSRSPAKRPATSITREGAIDRRRERPTYQLTCECGVTLGPWQDRRTRMLVDMSFLLLAVVAAAVAYAIGKVWAIVIPLVVGGVLTVAMAALGGSLYDAPVPMTIAIATFAAALGVFVRRQLASLSRA